MGPQGLEPSERLFPRFPVVSYAGINLYLTKN